MFSDVKLLIADREIDTARAIQRAAEALSFQTRMISTIAQYMDEKADALVLSLGLANGRADLCLDRWVARNQGPVCVLADERTPVDVENDLVARGAWNVMRRPIRLEAMQAVLYRYGSVVLQRKRLAALEGKVQRMERALLALALLVAAVGGVEVVPWLAQLLGL